MKLLTIIFTLLIVSNAMAEAQCDIRVGKSVGVQVVEFASGNVVHSKIPVIEMTPSALEEEMINLQDMGVCAEKLAVKKCILKLEKKAKANFLTMFRGQDRWVTWAIKYKKQAQEFIKRLQTIGFCS